MSSDQVIALLPLLVLAGAGVLVMLAIAFWRSHILVFGLTLAGLAASFAMMFVSWPYAGRPVTFLLRIDSYALCFTGLMLAASFAIGLFSYRYLKNQPGQLEEFYLLLLLATLGAAVLVSSSHFASFFLGLELLSVSLYPLIAYQPQRASGLEGALKYLILAGVSSAFLLFGMALVYAALGTLEFGQIAARLGASNSPVLLWTGMGLLIVGFGFKLALVPFHLWTPDVYQGAPAPATAFIASVSKGAMFALLLRYFTEINYHQARSLLVVFMVLSAASMSLGNLLALFQSNVKRLLAYSSIAHLGYLLVAFVATGPAVPTVVGFYLAAYFISILGAFGVVTMLSKGGGEAERLEDYEGLAWRRPWLAAAFTAMLLSLAGLPFSIGFIGKFYILAAGAGSGLWGLMILLVVASAIGLFYYLRVVLALYRPVAVEEERAVKLPSLGFAGGFGLCALTGLLVWLGVYPSPLLEFLNSTLVISK